jgi:hypothetical protein
VWNGQAYRGYKCDRCYDNSSTFIQLQINIPWERELVTSSTCAAFVQQLKSKLDWLSLRRQFYVLRLI